MIKVDHAGQGRGPISQKVIAGVRKARKRKVVDLSQFKESRLDAENLDKTVITGKEMAHLDPVHAVYVYAQNKMSVVVEQLSELPELSRLADPVADAQDEYMPSYPPMSPLTTSYFTCWAFFDLAAGVKRETFGAVTIDLCRVMGVDESLITLFERLQASRMGFYVVEEVSGRYVRLREMVTGKRATAISPSGYMGKAGQIWYARVLPEPFPDLRYGYGVVFTTPYVTVEIDENDRIVSSSERKWMDFFDRNLPVTDLKDPTLAYEDFMKHGLSRRRMNYSRPGMCCWNEYVFQAYVNHRDDMILLAGYPDIPLSMPHSKESTRMRGEI